MINSLTQFTTNGLKIIIELEAQIIFLPDKCTNVPKEVIYDLLTGNYYLQKIMNGINYKLIFEK